MSIARLMQMAASGQGGEPDPNFNQTVLLLHGDGTNGAQNNTFLDSSTNNFTITRNGNTTQGTFSPFSLPNGEWSNYFDGTGDYITAPSNSAFDFGSGDFTIEMWVYKTVTGSQSFLAQLIGSPSAINQSIGIGTFNDQVAFDTAVGSTYYSVTVASSLTLNTWNHIACVRSGSTLTVYINGTSAGTGSVTGTLNSIAAPMTIGRLGNFDGYYTTGYISNLRIIKGTALYTTGFTPSTTPLTAISGTSLLTCQFNRFVDNSTNNFAISITGNPSVQPFSPFLPTAEYDASVNGGSGYFDGLSDNLTAASDAAFSFGTGDFTWEAWIYKSGAWVTTAGTFEIMYATPTTNGFVVGRNDGNLIVRSFGVANVSSTPLPPANSWNHIVSVRSGTTLSLYVNGIRVDTDTDSTNFAQSSIAIGNDGSGSSYLGYISNLRVVKGTAIYDPTLTTLTVPTSPVTAVSGTSLLCNFTNAGIFDNTGKNNLETVGNAQIDTTTKKYGTGSMEFDGTGDWLIGPTTVNCDFGTGDFTIEGWLYPTAVTGTDRCLWDTRASAGDSGMVLFINSSGNLSTYTSGSIRITSTGTLSANTWQHFALVRSNGTLAFYIDGTQSGTLSYATAITCPGVISIAVRQDAAAPYTGFIDDFRITKGVARYTTTFTPPTAAFPNL